MLKNYCSTFTLLYAVLLTSFLFSASGRLAAQTNETIAAGSYIVNMGITPQNDGNGLKPYGMIYDLLRNYQVPVKWVINPTKGRNGIDFTHNGTNYSGGTFIIPAEYRTAAVNTKISTWVNQEGVIGANSVSAITVPVYGTLKSAPRWALNPDKVEISSAYLDDADLPSNSYYVKSASALNNCDDIFLIPHDDNISAANLATWNQVHKGYIWVGCKSGSVMENDVAKFLTTTGLNGFGGSWGNPTVTYDFNGDPPMQFMGSTAHQQNQANGANRSYTPKAAWRPTTKKLIYITGQQRVAMVYGPAFGDLNRGFVMISGGHDYNKEVTSTPNRVALIRAMLNFSFMSVLNKSVAVTMNIPTIIPAGVPTTFTYTLVPPGGSYSTLWTSSCGGTFSPNATSASVSYTPPANVTSCIITVRLTDACGRVSFDSRPIDIGCILNVQHTATPTTCNGGTNGAINMTITGGAAPYSWNWSRVSPAGTGTGTGTSITGLSAGTYNVTVSSPAGCSSTFSTLISQPNAITATATAVNTLCFGQTGAVNLSVNGGTPGYTYSWTGPSGFTATTQNLSNRPVGTYNVTVTDANNCTTTATATITGPATAVTVALNSKTDVSCNGGSNGSINITASGGTPGYTYAWSDGPTSEDRTGLTAGTYTVTVTDANGCTGTRTEAISEISGVVLTSTQVNVACAGGNNGSIQLTASGGTPPYNVSWSGASSGNPAGNEIAASGGSYNITGLAAGVFNITVTDNTGCTATLSRTITAPAVLTATPTVTNTLCFGQTGAISLAVSGGTAPRTYSWTGPSGFTATTQNISNRPAGAYNVTVTDANNCTATATATISGPATAVAVALDSKTNVSCNGGSNGTINITASGGTPGYTYAWSDGPTSEDRTGLTAGTYTVTVTDANGCTGTRTEAISEISDIVLTSTQINVACAGGNNGSIQLTASGGTPPYNVSWSGASSGNPAGNEIAASGGSYNITGLAAGVFNITVTDNTGCTATLSRTITAPAVLTATPTVTNYLCFGQTGAISLAVSGGTAPRTYSWTGPSGFTATTQNISNRPAGTYNVTVTDANNCTATATATISGPATAVTVALNSKTNVSCNGGSNGSINITASGGTPGYTYAWSDGPTSEDRTGLTAGTYTVTVTDANGCTATRTEAITQATTIVIAVSKTDPTCPPGAGPPLNSNGAIDLTVSGGTGSYTYNWADLTPPPTEPQDRTGLSAGTYSVTVTDSNGCTAMTSVTLVNINPSPVQPGVINNN